MRAFGERLRARIKAAGFGNINSLLKSLGINHSLVHDLQKGNTRDTGLRKIATIAVMLGMRPSDLVRDLDDLLLNPEPMPAELAEALSVPPRAGGFDNARLTLIADAVMAWDDDAQAARRPEELGELIGALYEELVPPEPAISMVDLRRAAMARLYGVELPREQTAARGPGRPAATSSR